MQTSSNEVIYVPSGLFIFPVSFLILFQFLSITLSITGMPFGAIVLLGFLSATGLSLVITKRFSTPIPCKRRHLLTMVTLSSFLSFLFLLRTNHAVYDLVCVTGILGLVTQVAEGNLPVSFLSFPEIPMNYHQGFVFLAGVFTLLTSIPVVITLKILFVFFFFLLNVGVMLFFIKERSSFYYLPPLLFLFIASVNNSFFNFFLTGINLPPVRVLENSGQNSWPLIFLAIVLLLFIGSRYTHKKTTVLLIGLILLSLSTANALAFQTIFISMVLFSIWHFVFNQKKKTRESNIVFLCLAIVAGALSILPKYIPSALMHGEVYGSPEIALRFLSPNSSSYLTDLIVQILISNVFPILVAVTATIFFAKMKPVFQNLYIGLLFTIMFPALFTFKNIIDWEMVHKLSLLSIFFSSLIITHLLSQVKKIRLILSGVIFISVVLSIENLYIHHFFASSLDIQNEVLPPSEMADVVSFLSQNKAILIPYRGGGGEYPWTAKPFPYCSTDLNYLKLAHYSGNFMRDVYDNNLLLNESLERQIFTNGQWWELEAKVRRTSSQLEAGEVLVVDKNRLRGKDLVTIEEILQAEKIEFKNYILYRADSQTR